MTSHSVPEEYARMLLVPHAAGAVVYSVWQSAADLSSMWPAALFAAVAVRGLGPVGSGLWRRFLTAGVLAALVVTSMALQAEGGIGVVSLVLTILLAAKLIAEKRNRDGALNQRG
ncbi:MAG: hypothetical protein ISQ06_05220 [Planctomycetaceae bacterium]|nr:hypothetical protein [Planctomycetaceae bacterium]